MYFHDPKSAKSLGFSLHPDVVTAIEDFTNTDSSVNFLTFRLLDGTNEVTLVARGKKHKRILEPQSHSPVPFRLKHHHHHHHDHEHHHHHSHHNKHHDLKNHHSHSLQSEETKQVAREEKDIEKSFHEFVKEITKVGFAGSGVCRLYNNDVVFVRWGPKEPSYFLDYQKEVLKLLKPYDPLKWSATCDADLMLEDILFCLKTPETLGAHLI
eukprot:Awhi_evm1s2316